MKEKEIKAPKPLKEKVIAPKDELQEHLKDVEANKFVVVETIDPAKNPELIPSYLEYDAAPIAQEVVVNLSLSPAAIEQLNNLQPKLEIIEVIEATSNPIHAKALKLLSEKSKQEIIDYAKKYNLVFTESNLVDTVVKFLVDKKPGAVELGRI